MDTLLSRGILLGVIAVALVGVGFVVVAWAEGGPCLAFVAAVFAGVGVMVAAQVGMALLRPAALDAYRAALARLAEDPTDPRRRREALELGRRYAGLTTGIDGKVHYTEEAIANDIRAAGG